MECRYHERSYKCAYQIWYGRLYRVNQRGLVRDCIRHWRRNEVKAQACRIQQILIAFRTGHMTRDTETLTTNARFTLQKWNRSSSALSSLYRLSKLIRDTCIYTASRTVHLHIEGWGVSDLAEFNLALALCLYTELWSGTEKSSFRCVWRHLSEGILHSWIKALQCPLNIYLCNFNCIYAPLSSIKQFV